LHYFLHSEILFSALRSSRYLLLGAATAVDLRGMSHLIAVWCRWQNEITAYQCSSSDNMPSGTDNQFIGLWLRSSDTFTSVVLWTKTHPGDSSFASPFLGVEHAASFVAFGG